MPVIYHKEGPTYLQFYQAERNAAISDICEHYSEDMLRNLENEMNEQRLFKAFADRKCGDLQLYEEIKKIIEAEVKCAERRLAAKQHECLVKLNNSENNAGW